MSRWVLAALCCSFVSAAGCVDPKQDYDDWLARTNDLRGAQSASDGGQFDVSLSGGFTQTYFMACLASIFQGNLNDVLLFQTKLTFTPAAGGGGTLAWTDVALVKQATDLSQTVGTPVSAMGTVTADGHCDVAFPDQTIIPAAADPLMPSDIIIKSSTFQLLVGSANQVCANLNAEILQPIPVTLQGTGNFCVFRPFAQPSGALPALKLADFHCP
jgi:hypothetical protein